MLTRRKFGATLSAAVAGIGASAATVAALAPQKNAKHVCKGHNECKGQGGCKTAKNDCAGKNDCKGRGGCSSGDNGCAGKNSCKGKGGCAVPLKAQRKSLRLRSQRRYSA